MVQNCSKKAIEESKAELTRPRPYCKPLSCLILPSSPPDIGIPILSPSLFPTADCGQLSSASVSYHIQFSFFQDIHQHLNLGVVVEEKVIIHPEDIFSGHL